VHPDLRPAVKPELEMDVPMSPGSGAEGPLTLKTLLASQNGVKFFKEFCESRCACFIVHTEGAAWP
jgi:hypothetical protein